MGIDLIKQVGTDAPEAVTETNTPVTVTITVAGREENPIQCYRLKGEGAKDLIVGDTVTVTGTLKNYQGTIEFNRPTMTYWKRGPGLTQAVNYGDLKEGVAYKMYMDQKALGKTYYFNGDLTEKKIWC